MNRFEGRGKKQSSSQMWGGPWRSALKKKRNGILGELLTEIFWWSKPRGVFSRWGTVQGEGRRRREGKISVLIVTNRKGKSQTTKEDFEEPGEEGQGGKKNYLLAGQESCRKEICKGQLEDCRGLLNAKRLGRCTPRDFGRN